MSGTASELWIRLDERDDVAGSIRHCVACVALVRADHVAWKWLILSLYSALQGACVCHLSTTAHPVGALTPKSTKAWLEYFDLSRHDSNTPLPETRLLSLPDLLKKVRKKRSVGSAEDGREINVTDRELQHFQHLHDNVRNQLVHFEPLGWSLDVSGLSTLIPATIRIIRQIQKAGWAFRHEDAAWLDALNQDLLALEQQSSALFVEIGPG